MEAYVSNYQLLYGWLNYLQEVAKPLVGTGKEQILTAVQNFELLDKAQAMSVECPLMGESSEEFSVDLYSHHFGKPADEKSDSSSIYDNFLKNYGDVIGDARELSLVLDTRTGKIKDSALFLDISRGAAIKVLRQVLAWQGEQRRMQPLARLMDRAENLEAIMLGFVFAHNNLPMRMSFRSVKTDGINDYLPIIEFMEKLGLRQTDRVNLELELIDRLDLFDYRLELDVLPDGKLSNAIGIELYLRSQTLEEQRQLLAEERYQNFLKFLKNTAKADSRAELLERCLFFADLRQAPENQEVLISGLSHFKLRYNAAGKLPAKVCLRALRVIEGNDN